MDQTAIHDVYQNGDSTNSHINIYFTLENQKYEFIILKDEDDMFTPFVLSRVNPEESANIPYPELDLNVLFHRLINHPSIRLEWLYIPYAEV